MRHQGIVPNPQQPMQRTHETSHRVNKTGRQINIQNVVQTHSSRRPSQKLVQEIHQNIQGSLHWGPEWMCKENAHALVVPTTTTGGTSTTSTTTVASEPRHVGVRTCVPRPPFLLLESLVDVKPHKQQTYAQHCNEGCVIGTSFKHYRCKKVDTSHA